MKAIITQDTTIVNFASIANVIIYSGNTFKTKFELRALSANNSNYYTLAVYETRKDAKAVFDILAHWLSTDEPVIDLNFPEYQNYDEEGEELSEEVPVNPAEFLSPPVETVAPVMPAPVAAPATSAPVTPTPVAVAPTPVAVAPTPVTPVATTVTPTPVAPTSGIPVKPTPVNTAAASAPLGAPVTPSTAVKMSVSGTSIELTEVPVDITVPPVPIEISKLAGDFTPSPVDITVPPIPFEFPPKS